MSKELFPIPNRGSWENIFFRLTKKTQGTATYSPSRFENEVFLITEPGGNGPNFLYKPTGFEIYYPDSVFRVSTRINQSLTAKQFISIISKCVKSIKKPKGKKNDKS
jgi:hypothetical protein